jgi:hypothetical protein
MKKNFFIKNENIQSKNLYIFNKYINYKSKLQPFNLDISPLKKIKYLPPVSKEWKNSIYVFNHNNLKNLPVFNLNVNYLIKSYFNLFFNPSFLHKKFISRRKRRLSNNKIYSSKAEIKHTNSKAIITVYTYNREKRILILKLKSLNKNFFNKIRFLISVNKLIFDDSTKNFFSTIIKLFLHDSLKRIRKYKLRFDLNKYKFEDKLLYKLNYLITRYYNKKIEFNIVNLKSLIFNSDLFTNILMLKIKKTRKSVGGMMTAIINRAILPKVNKRIERSLILKDLDFNLLKNKDLNLNINSILKNKYNLEKFLNKLYYNLIIKLEKNKNVKENEKLKIKKNILIQIYKIIFNSIKYKNMEGIRLEVRGRLTKRYRADRAVYRLRWKGGLKDIYSSYKGLSSVNMRGDTRPNLEYSIFTSKRRVGSFAVKGWISGK